MTSILVNIDVNDLAAAERFYCAAFLLEPGRRIGPGAMELVGASSRIYLLDQPAGTPAFPQSVQQRSYDRHWTPVHLDFVVDDLEAGIARSISAGGTQQHPVREHAWGRLATFSDPFGHGYCLIQFSAEGYEAIESVPMVATRPLPGEDA